ncbi:MAG: hypothetical protein LUH36_04055 [Oscillospiraceae bacterium]|nr:hypothetical protein [Oscillospiraceae bacterium]
MSLSDVTVSKTYDGKPVNDPTVSVTLVNGDIDYTQTISYYDAADNLLDSAPSAVGSYQVVATIDAGSNYSIATAEASFTILAAEQTVVIDGFTNVPYDGKPHEVTVTAGEDAAVTVIYTDADGNTVEAPVEAGAYTAHVTVARTGYTTVEQDVAVSITAAAQAISYATAAVTKTEGDAPFTNVLTQTTVFGAITYASSDTSVAVVDDSGKVTIVGAGTAAITASVSGSDSYTAATAAYTLTVNPAADENTVDKSALQAAYDSSLGMMEGDYTAASWAVLTSAQEAAKAVLDDDAATQEEVDSALAALNAAIAALKSEPAGTPAAIAAPDTGDGNTPVLWLGMTLLCAGTLAVTAVVKKKRD